MNRRIFESITLFLFILAVFFLPTYINNKYSVRDTETFYKRVDRDYQSCVENARAESLNDRWCREIRSATELSFNSGTNVADNSSSISILQTLLVVLSIWLFGLIRRVRTLEKK